MHRCRRCRANLASSLSLCPHCHTRMAGVRGRLLMWNAVIGLVILGAVVASLMTMAGAWSP